MRRAVGSKKDQTVCRTFRLTLDILLLMFQHMQSKHPGTLFQCELCDYASAVKHSLEIHRQGMSRVVASYFLNRLICFSVRSIVMRTLEHVFVFHLCVLLIVLV